MAALFVVASVVLAMYRGSIGPIIIAAVLAFVLTRR